MIRRCIIGWLVILLAGCSTIQISDDYNPDFNFKKLSSFVVLYNKSADSLSKDRIVKALTEAFEAKGYKAVSKDKANFYVVFHTHVTDKSQIVTDYKVIGVPYYGYNYHGYRHPYRYNGGTAVVPVTRQINYKEGKLVVDALDAKTKKIFRRGTATDRLKSLKTPEERWAYIKRVVTKLLQSFPAKNKPAAQKS